MATSPHHPNPPTITTSSPSLVTIDSTTILSLLGTVAALALAHALSLRLLPRSAGTTARVLFIWHAFDAAIHAVFEGSFLWNVFFVSAPRDALPGSLRSPFEPLPPGTHWFADPTRLYGAFYGRGPFSRLWQEYAKADRRWGGSDTGVVSLEVLTVVLGAPLAVVCAEGVRRGAGRSWFWMTVLATGELYGGWMTFAPEWLTGSPNLDTSNWMYKYLYLSFFNLLWVFFPLWVLRLAYVAFADVGKGESGEEGEGKKRL
ncbi:Emopamil-binding protein [Phyllosticta citrichinensis]|uniref:Emopamil-binding protein n=1 Tax=Phyllosticta citrichinensis TaxID=1130410 RepID=A0ABR1XKP9_9PEZI